MKRVLHISKYYYPFIGGTEQVCRDFALALKETDAEQKIICFNEDAEMDGMICKRSETVHDMVDGIEVIRCGYFAKVASQSLSFTYITELKKVMNDFKPDVVIFHYPNPFVAELLLQYKKRDFKLLLYWHLDITKQKFLKKVFHGQNLRLVKRTDVVLGATPKHVDESAYSEYFENKKQILPYAINAERLVISEEERIESEKIREKYQGKFLGFFIGRHVPYKGVRYLIEASRLLDDRFHFIVAGNGELTEELKTLAKGDPKVEFVGRITDAQWRAYLNACDVFCFPSITRNEGFGLALAEGMYFRKPALTFTIPGSGVNYVNLDGITGIESPNCDSRAYADALRKLADDPELCRKYGEAARQRVLDNFTTERFVENVKELMKTL